MPVIKKKRPLEDWCPGGDRPVVLIPSNGHIRCSKCPRIISIIDGMIRRHRKIELETRYMTHDSET